MLNGDAVYDRNVDNGSARAILTKAAAHFETLLLAGWRPQQLGSNFEHWRPREHNKLADYMCNRTIDEARDWHWHDAELLATLRA